MHLIHHLLLEITFAVVFPFYIESSCTEGWFPSICPMGDENSLFDYGFTDSAKIKEREKEKEKSFQIIYFSRNKSVCNSPFFFLKSFDFGLLIE